MGILVILFILFVLFCLLMPVWEAIVALRKSGETQEKIEINPPAKDPAIYEDEQISTQRKYEAIVPEEKMTCYENLIKHISEYVGERYGNIKWSFDSTSDDIFVIEKENIRIWLFFQSGNSRAISIKNPLLKSEVEKEETADIDIISSNETCSETVFNEWLLKNDELLNRRGLASTQIYLAKEELPKLSKDEVIFFLMRCGGYGAVELADDHEGLVLYIDPLADVVN